MPPNPSHHRELNAIVAAVGTVLLGKETQIRLALACCLARGHLLIEDLPGMGKTTLAHGLAAALGLSFNRIQFTSDLLPADILGISIYEAELKGFRFHPGPIFCQLLLADEINRTTPKTQSALLEAMAEGQVTVEGETRPLPSPFFVIATQNPGFQSGTFPLPESQQDRFMLRISLGYPDPVAERQLLEGGDSRERLARIRPVIDPARLLELQRAATAVHASPAVLDYLQRLVAYTRTATNISCGLSPRAALALLQCARAHAMIAGRDYVIPEDIQALFPALAGHRLQGEAVQQGGALVEQVLNAVDIL
ncbi:MAG: MoxR family ATPase [Porticoccaceae bacterium]|jgi:MoxR-like ATPase|nr:MoxR family ATPase [Porticoccaceae bacterium]